MTKKVAINGFGRIGRLMLRRLFETESELEIVAVNDLTNTANLAYLFKYDTAYGPFKGTIEVEEDSIIINQKKIQTYAEKDASKLPWAELGIDIVLECTGFYTSAEKAQAHIDAGAKRVLISAPASNVKMVVPSVNLDKIESQDKVISAASCTTNSLAPLVKVLNDAFKIKAGNMVTIHGYTATQSLQDGPNSSWRSGRAAAQNIIPASTGAAKAIGKVVPEVDGKLDGSALRAPTITGSHTIFYSLLENSTTVEEINEKIKEQANESFVYNEDQIVSSDVIGLPAGSVFDATLTEIQEAEDGAQLVKTVAWYDNEYGFVGNMARTLEYFATFE